MEQIRKIMESILNIMKNIIKSMESFLRIMEKLLKMMAQNSRQWALKLGKFPIWWQMERNTCSKKKFVGKRKSVWKVLGFVDKYGNIWWCVLAWEFLDIKKTNYGSTTLEVFLFNHRRKLSFLWQVYSSLSATLPWKSNTSLISLDTFPRRAHFVIMDFLRNRPGKQFYMKLGTLAVKGIDLHKFSFPNSSPVRLGSVCANILGRLVDDSWQDNRLPSTRERG